MSNLSRILIDLQARRNQTQRELGHLDAAIAALHGLNGRSGKSTSRAGAIKPRRVMSAAARRKIAIAKKAWWANKSSNAALGASHKRTLSLSARRKIAAAQRARWARVRQEKKAA
ncbi:MAG: hypothetical protein DMG74_10615 [Acidobacteria bacterium]|nr:MAG: hypothetical protein DMG74_10615 [Acidobacteriota bacterium]